MVVKVIVGHHDIKRTAGFDTDSNPRESSDNGVFWQTSSGTDRHTRRVK
jgi:hypothetical protein